MSTAAPRLLLLTSLVAAVVTVCYPVLLVGVPYSVPAADPEYGLIAGSLAASLVGPAVVGLITGRDFDAGTRADRIALGSRGDTLATTQLVLAVAATLATVAATVCLVAAGAIADQLVRTLAGTASTQVVPGRPPFLLPLLPVGLTFVTWVLTMATRSGRRGLMLLAVTIASWAAFSPALAQSSARSLLAFHPMALPWSIFRPFESNRFDFTAPWWQLLPIACVWVGLALWAALANTTQPGSRR